MSEFEWLWMTTHESNREKEEGDSVGDPLFFQIWRRYEETTLST